MKSTNRTWTTDKFVKLSQALGWFYSDNPISSRQPEGLSATKLDRQRDSWTTDKFIEMSRNLSSAYGVDF